MPAPISAPARKSPPLANSNPKTNGRSAKENEWALRRNCRWTTQVSAITHATAITHHGRWGWSRGGSPFTDVRKSVAASAARTRPYTDTATGGDTRRRAGIAWAGEVVNSESSPPAALVGRTAHSSQTPTLRSRDLDGSQGPRRRSRALEGRPRLCSSLSRQRPPRGGNHTG